MAKSSDRAALDAAHACALADAAQIDEEIRPAIEVLLGTPRVRELLKKNAVEELKGAMVAGTTDGMQTFDQSLYSLLQAGLITEEDALLAADSANDLRLRMRGFSVVSG